METLHLIGRADGLKPLYILEIFINSYCSKGKKIYYVTDSMEGVAVEFCKENKIEIICVNPENICDFIRVIKDTKPYFLISIGWSFKLPGKFLTIFQYAINCHGGLLPDYRGNNVYMHNYANISEQYGATIHYMNDKFDDGNIIIQAKAKLYLEETPLIMHRRICEMTGWILPEAIHLVESGYKGDVQTGKARYFFKMDRMEMEKLRNKNINKLLEGEKKEVSRCREWIIDDHK